MAALTWTENWENRTFETSDFEPVVLLLDAIYERTSIAFGLNGGSANALNNQAFINPIPKICELASLPTTDILTYIADSIYTLAPYFVNTEIDYKLDGYYQYPKYFSKNWIKQSPYSIDLIPEQYNPVNTSCNYRIKSDYYDQSIDQNYITVPLYRQSVETESGDYRTRLNTFYKHAKYWLNHFYLVNATNICHVLKSRSGNWDSNNTWDNFNQRYDYVADYDGQDTEDTPEVLADRNDGGSIISARVNNPISKTFTTYVSYDTDYRWYTHRTQSQPFMKQNYHWTVGYNNHPMTLFVQNPSTIPCSCEIRFVPTAELAYNENLNKNPEYEDESLKSVDFTFHAGKYIGISSDYNPTTLESYRVDNQYWTEKHNGTPQSFKHYDYVVSRTGLQLETTSSDITATVYPPNIQEDIMRYMNGMEHQTSTFILSSNLVEHGKTIDYSTWMWPEYYFDYVKDVESDIKIDPPYDVETLIGIDIQNSSKIIVTLNYKSFMNYISESY